jgi:hypothetical protein
LQCLWLGSTAEQNEMHSLRCAHNHGCCWRYGRRKRLR